MTPEEFEREKMRLYHREYRAKNREKLNAYQRERYHNNTNGYRDYQKAYNLAKYHANIEESRRLARERHARTKEAMSHETSEA